MPRKNTDKLYYQSNTNKNTFLRQLDITQKDRAMLLSSRAIVRKAIREAFKAPLVSGSPEMMSVIKGIKPKFVTQGSFVYDTLNAPCREGQQIDLDDGVYLPMSLFDRYGKDKEMLTLFFKLIDTTLIRLCSQQKGWSYDDKQKKCGRIILSESAHLDTPLYAIPDLSYLALNKQRVSWESQNSSCGLHLLY